MMNLNTPIVQIVEVQKEFPIFQMRHMFSAVQIAVKFFFESLGSLNGLALVADSKGILEQCRA